jgi:hypothetical protein
MFIEKPYNDELLSSWLMRLAKINYTNLSSMLHYILKKTLKNNHNLTLHIKDLDLYNFNDTQKLAIYEVTKVKIENYQLLKYIGFLDEDITTKKKLWITSANCTKKWDVSNYPRFCPLCLKEKSYIKQYWRVMLYNICTKHSCFILDRCPKCKMGFKYQNNEYSKNIFECFYCNYDLRKASIKFISKQSKYLKTQNKLLNILELGYYKINNKYYYSISIFKLLRELFYPIRQISKKNKEIHEFIPEYLIHIFEFILFLLQKFPERINKFYKKNHLTNKTIMLGWSRTKDNIPSWFLNSIEYNTLNTERKPIIKKKNSSNMLLKDIFQSKKLLDEVLFYIEKKDYKSSLFTLKKINIKNKLLSKEINQLEKKT